MTIPTSDEVRAAIKQNVTDPEIGINIVDLGLVYDVEVQEKDGSHTAEIQMTLTSPGCPLGPAIIKDIQNHVGAAFPQLSGVNIQFVWVPPWTPEMMSAEAKDELGFF